MKLRKKMGFTLIELLIVVAIIAILALIAVPNFLEAQTRSKVSRCKTDMRSLATGIESYHVDTNAYPVGFGYPEGYVKFRLARITTPIQYMSSLPDDPFRTWHTDVGPAPGDKPSFIYLLRQYHNFPLYYDTDPGFRMCVNSRAIQWVLVSQGPVHPDTTWVFWIPYDPTNGTVSFGIITRSGP